MRYLLTVYLTLTHNHSIKTITVNYLMEYLTTIFNSGIATLIIGSILICSFYLTIYFGSKAIKKYAGKINKENFLIIEVNQTIICLAHAFIFFKIVFLNESLWWLVLIPSLHIICYSIYKHLTKEVIINTKQQFPEI